MNQAGTLHAGGYTASDEGWRTLRAYIGRPCICVVPRSWSPARAPPVQWSTANDEGWLTTLAYVVRACIYAKKAFRGLGAQLEQYQATSPAACLAGGCIAVKVLEFSDGEANIEDWGAFLNYVDGSCIYVKSRFKRLRTADGSSRS